VIVVITDELRRSLEDSGLSLWRGRFENHDFLWFATTDLNATASTWPILHNYALTYAICQYSHAAYLGFRPSYDADLDRMKAYALPAQNAPAGRTRFTQNAIDEITQRTDKIVGSNGRLRDAKFNTPKLGRRVCLTPTMTIPAGSGSAGFEVHAFCWDNFRPPPVFRLGKKGCPIRVWWDEIQDATAVLDDSAFSPIHPVNPRDLLESEADSIVSYYPAFLPPHLLYTRVTLRKEWKIRVAAGRWIHVPARVVRRWQPGRHGSA
jgi:CRISPR type I-D-associated protein Csc1